MENLRTTIIDGVQYVLIEIKRMDTTEFFIDLEEAKKHIYKKIWISGNKITGDRSYMREPLSVVAEDDKRIQVIVNNIGIGERLVVLFKNEHDIDIAKVR